MVTIEKDSFRITCSDAMYEHKYRDLGYQIVPNKKGAVEKQSPLIIEEDKINEKTIDDLKNVEEKINEEEYGLKNTKIKKSK